MRDFQCTFDARDTLRALEGTGIVVPPLDTYAPKLWDYWERNLDPDLFRDRSLAGAIRGKKIVITGGSSGHRLRHRAEGRRGRRRSRSSWRARAGSLRRGPKKAIEDEGGESPHLLGRPVEHRRDRRVHPAHPAPHAQGPRPHRHAGQQRRPVDPPRRHELAGRTASTTTSARCSSTTTARSR